MRKQTKEDYTYTTVHKDDFKNITRGDINPDKTQIKSYQNTSTPPKPRQ